MTKKDVNVNELPIFNDIKDGSLRSRNRGAILANIYETYVRDHDSALIYLENYLQRVPTEERSFAKTFMVTHLKERGYSFGS